MSLGVVELAFFMVVAAGSALAVRRTGRRWLALLPFVVLIAALFSPADIVSTLLIALPNALLLGVAVCLAQRPAPGKSPT